MSIINLKKTFENGKLVYCNINNKIIECTCLSKLYKFNNEDDDNKDLGIYFCNIVKIITIYDIYKNIIYEPIQTDLFKDLIKNGEILENVRRHILFFKTFMGALIRNNKLNDIKYYTNCTGALHKFLYDNIQLIIFNNEKFFNIYNNERKLIHTFKYKEDCIIYKHYNDEIEYTIYNDFIKITKGPFPFLQTIFLNKDLQIFKIKNYSKNKYETKKETRNDNNEIISYDNIEEIFYYNNTNPPFSKPLKKDYIKLINYYKKNINNYTELKKILFKKEKEAYNNLLLCYKLEIINSK